MASVTIHDLDDSVAKLIRERARLEGLSVNKMLKRLLEEAVGVKPSTTHRKHFERFCGMWSKAQLAEFEKATAELEKIDASDWR